jgi:hypothetical protein
MNIFDKTCVLLFLAAIILASCNSSLSTPTMSDAEIMETALSTVSTGLAETQPALPTATATPSRSPATQVPPTFTRTPAPETYLIVDAGKHPNLWDGPGTQFDVIGPISQKRYPVIGKHADWWLLDLGNNRSGWIHVITHGTRFVGNAEAVPEVVPPATPTPHVLPSSTPRAFSDPSIPLSERIVYYYRVRDRETPIPEGAVRAAYLLAPTYADETYTSDTAADLRTALDIVWHDERNRWAGPDFEPEIVDITFRSGHAEVRLQGEYSIGEPSASRDVYGPFVDRRMLILLTVFANPAVQTAAVWLNDDTIGNLAISDRKDAKPANYVFRRAEIETYLKENAYVPPPPRNTPTPFVFTTPTPPAFIDPSLPLPKLPPNAINLQWITAYGLPGDQRVTKIHPTRDEGFILLGSGVLLKLRADGLILWQKSLGGVAALDVLETSAGDFILAGDLHWIKLDSQGKLLWQHTFREPSYHTGPILHLVEESNGNIVVEALGSRTVFSADGELQSITEYAMQWDSQTYSGRIKDRSGEVLWVGENGDHQYWIGKADRNSGWLNVFSFPEKPIGGPLLLQTLADGGALISVPIYGEGGYDLLVSRFSRDGLVRWQNVFGGQVWDTHIAFETRSGDFIVVGGVTDYSAFSFREDVRIMRLDKDGNTRWMKVYGTAGWDPEGLDAVALIQELSNSDLIFAGHTNGAGTGDQDMWILKTNAQGEIPNCGLALDRRAGLAGGVSSEGETIALEGNSRIEREVIPILEEEPGPFGDADARVIPFCLPSP